MEYHVQVRLCNFTCRFALIVVTSVPGTKTSHVTTTTETLQSGNEIDLVTRISQSRVRTFGPGLEIRSSVVTRLEATFSSVPARLDATVSVRSRFRSWFLYPCYVSVSVSVLENLVLVFFSVSRVSRSQAQRFGLGLQISMPKV